MFGERAVPSSSIFYAIQARAGIEGSIAEKHLGSGDILKVVWCCIYYDPVVVEGVVKEKDWLSCF